MRAVLCPLLWAAQALLCSRLSAWNFGHPAAGQEVAQAQDEGSCSVPQNFTAAGQGGFGVSSPGTGMGLGPFTPFSFGFPCFSNPQILVLRVK